MPSEPELTQRSQHQILAELRNAAALLYPEESSARVIVDDAGLDARQIAFSSRAESNWHNIWLTAIRQNQVDALVVVLAERYPNNPPLQAAIANYQRFLATDGQFNTQALLADSAPDDDAPAPGESPYQGMAYYDAVDADRFFGREALTAELVDHLRQQPLLAVVGASGSGKSSLVRAGVMPALQGKTPLVDGKQPPAGSARWAYHLITPTARPLESLAASLTRSSESVTATSTLIDDLGRDARSLHLYARRLVSGEQRLLLLVDQFEELFTLCKNETEQGAFVDNLLYAAQPDNDPKNSVVTLVLTLRADFYHHCARFPALRAALENQQKYIGAMTRDELRRAIEEPAKAGAWEFQAGLVEQLLQDVGQEPGALPLLSHALLETWHRRRGRTLTLVGYRAAGGVQGAIAKTADDVFNRFTDEQKTIARIIFLRLTELGEGVQDTRRRVRPDELKLTHAGADKVQDVLGKLTKARLVTTDIDEIQVAHEALIRNWGTLREWLDDNREGNRIQRRLTEAADQWIEFGKDTTLLYRGVLLQQAQEWLRSTIDPPNQQEMEFLQVSEGEVAADVKRVADLAIERERNRQRELEQSRILAETQQRRTQTFRLWSAIAAILFLIATITAVWGLQNWNNAVATRSIAQSRKLADSALANLEIDPELSILLARHAVSVTYTIEAENALRQALQMSRIKQRLEDPGSDFVRAIYSPDGEHLAAAGRNGKVIIWHLLDPEPAVQELTIDASPDGVNGELRDLAYNPDGTKLATAHSDGTARIWDVKSGAPLLKLSSHELEVLGITFSPDGRQLATAGLDFIAIVWDLSGAGKNLRELYGHNKGVSSITFNPNGKRLATAGRDNVVILWDAETGEMLETLAEHTDRVHAVAFSPNEAWLASASADKTVILWNLTGEHPVKRIPLSEHTNTVIDVKFSANSKCLATASLDRTVKIWNVETGKLLINLTGHTDGIYSVAFRPVPPDSKGLVGIQHCGLELATASLDGTVRLWNIGAPYEDRTYVGHAEPVESVTYSSDGQHVAAGSDDGVAYIWDVETGQQATSLKGHDERVNRIAYSHNGQYLATASYDATARLWNVKGDQSIATLIDHGANVESVAFSPDDTMLATASDDGTAQIWSVPDGNFLKRFEHGKKVYGVVFSPDGKFLLSTGAEGTIKVWDIESGEVKQTFFHGNNEVYDAVFNPNGTLWATISWDATAKLWTWPQGELLYTLVGHTDRLYGVAFSPDDTTLVTSSADHTARVWNVQSGQLIRMLYGPEFNGLSFHPDGQHVVISGEDGTVRVYALLVDQLLALAQQRVTRSFSQTECNEYLHQNHC